MSATEALIIQLIINMAVRFPGIALILTMINKNCAKLARYVRSNSALLELREYVGKDNTFIIHYWFYLIEQLKVPSTSEQFDDYFKSNTTINLQEIKLLISMGAKMTDTSACELLVHGDLKSYEYLCKTIKKCKRYEYNLTDSSEEYENSGQQLLYAYNQQIVNVLIRSLLTNKIYDSFYMCGQKYFMKNDEKNYFMRHYIYADIRTNAPHQQAKSRLPPLGPLSTHTVWDDYFGLWHDRIDYEAPFKSFCIPAKKIIKQAIIICMYKEGTGVIPVKVDNYKRIHGVPNTQFKTDVRSLIFFSMVSAILQHGNPDYYKALIDAVSKWDSCMISSLFA